jgi:uncharacterized membrane protein (UPF0127 family)
MKIGKQEFKVTVPDDPRKGLLGTKSIAKDRLMKFSFPDGNAHITMKGMGYPIDLIAVDKGKVSQVIKARVGEDYMFKAKEVYEAKNDSGIEIGQVVKAQNGSVLAKLLNKVKSHSKGGLLILDNKANVQHEISDGSRIFSRIHTKQLLEMRDKVNSRKSGGSIKESHKELAELFFKFITHQDKLEPEYV